MLKEHYGPGADTGRVPLVHDGEEGGIVISGRLEVTWVRAMPIISRVATLPLRRQRALRGDQRLHAADVLRRRTIAIRFALGREV
jgi:hypothetical protein